MRPICTNRPGFLLPLVCAVCLCTVTLPSSALIINNSDVNDTAPTGQFADSGWQWTGSWGVGAGIAISQKCFVTGKHFYVSSDTFTLNDGKTYTRVSYEDDPNSDLRIVEIAETFSTWAPLYTGGDELGEDLVVVGRGYTKGEEIPDKGWKMSDTAGTMHWGTNTVSAYSGYTTSGDDKLLKMEFNAPGSAEDSEYEAGIMDRDSGGGVFIQDNGIWKLAGVNYSIEGPFDDDYDHTSGTFFGALYDKGGFWQNKGFWDYISDSSQDKPYSWYATRVSLADSWIQGHITPITPGDANGDGAVDLDDFIILKSNFSEAGGWSEGDFDGNGTIDLSDFNILKGNFTGAGANVRELDTLIPEPSTILLLSVAFVGTARRRRGKLG